VGKPLLLLADDDAAVRELLIRAFRADFEVVQARDGTEAVNALQRVIPDAVVADHMMPGCTGIDVLDATRERAPHAVRVLITAHHSYENVVSAVNRGEIHRFFGKP